MEKIVVIGVGMTRFAFMPERGIKEMVEEAVCMAMEDAGVKPSDIQVAYCGNIGQHQAGSLTLPDIGIKKIPITRVENLCASGTGAFRECYFALRSGMYDVALAFGIEKMSVDNPLLPWLTKKADPSNMILEEIIGLSIVGIFSLWATRHMAKYGTTRRQISLISVKDRYNASLNKYAHFQSEVTAEEVEASPMVAEPLRVFDFCPVTDGAAAVILATEKAAKRFNSSKPIEVAASVQVSGEYEYLPQGDYDGSETTQRAAKMAYEQSGLGPEDIDVAEVASAATIQELIGCEDLGFCKKGEGGPFVESGKFSLGGKIPINPGGGLLSRGHPIGASGPAQIYEIVEQLRGRAGKRQVEGARIGLTHNGGFFQRGALGAMYVHIFKSS
jgi:acetyl-CoA acetyltransferase